MSTAPHRFELRVYYEDTDAAGIVYYANYLRFAERARTEFLRSRGHDHVTLRRVEGGLFAVTRCAVRYRVPARLDDVLTVQTGVVRAHGARLELLQHVCRQATTLAEVEVELAFLGENMKPRRLPSSLIG